MNTQRLENIDSSVNIKLESLSACIDGELSAAHRDELLAQFERDDALQTEWSLYHCIGDVLRSDELSCHAGGFNARFAAALANEPHLLAPQSAQAVMAGGDPRKSRWVKPLSLAASMAAVAVVAGVAMQQWNGSNTGSGADIARASTGAVQPVAAVAPMQPVPNAYLAAHRQYGSQRAALYIQTVAQDSGK